MHYPFHMKIGTHAKLIKISNSLFNKIIQHVTSELNYSPLHKIKKLNEGRLNGFNVGLVNSCAVNYYRRPDGIHF